MKAIISVILLVLVLSCKKDIVAPPPDANNKFDATITFVSGEVLEFSARGSDVKFDCSFGLGSLIVADQSPATFSLSYINAFDCVSGPGSYNFCGNYYVNVKSQFSPIYTSWYGLPIHDLGSSITYTVVDGKYVEGYFNTICKRSAIDSVLVKGTFSGYKKW